MDNFKPDEFLNEIDHFATSLHAFTVGELDRKTYKGISGGFGSYAQRAGGSMLRLRMGGGRLTKERLAFLADAVARYQVGRIKLTTCQTVQLHDLDEAAVLGLMRDALAHGIVTKGGGGDHPRNVMVSPRSGVEPGEHFDVLPAAEAVGEYLLGRMGALHMPRKLKVGFSNSEANTVHATFRDLGFVARRDGNFDVYCAGGLGPNPKLGVQVGTAVPQSEALYYVEAMIRIFTAHGNYENRARARTRYLQDSLGADGLRAAFAATLVEVRREDLSIQIEDRPITKGGSGSIGGPRVLPQKQPGLFSVRYHPIGGCLPPEKPSLFSTLTGPMEAVEWRIGPDGTLYCINLTAEEAASVLSATADGADTLFEHSVCCIGAAVCQNGVRDTQATLAAMVEAARREGFADGVLPQVHLSGCPSSCGTHQVGTLGFHGGVKLIDKQPVPAYTLHVGGADALGTERFGTPLGMILERDIPAFLVDLGRAVAASGERFATWYPAHAEALKALAGRYLVS